MNPNSMDGYENIPMTITSILALNDTMEMPLVGELEPTCG
jgi:hypothetical protein